MKITARFERGSPPAAAPQAPPIATRAASDAPAPSSAARNLAIAHHLARLIERGLIADFTAAARMLGVSQPRLTHLMGLLLLAPEIQAAVLFDEMHFGEKELRVLARIADWSQQMAQIRLRRRETRASAGHGRLLPSMGVRGASPVVGLVGAVREAL